MKKQKKGNSYRLTATTIPKTVVGHLDSAWGFASRNFEHAVALRDKPVAQANRKVLRRIGSLLAICNKYNSQG